MTNTAKLIALTQAIAAMSINNGAAAKVNAGIEIPAGLMLDAGAVTLRDSARSEGLGELATSTARRMLEIVFARSMDQTLALAATAI